MAGSILLPRWLSARRAGVLVVSSCIFVVVLQGFRGMVASGQEMQGTCFIRNRATRKTVQQLGPCTLRHSRGEDGSDQTVLTWNGGLHQLTAKRLSDGSLQINGKPGYEIADDSWAPQSISCYGIEGESSLTCFMSEI
jgi:hypothetical protein